MTHIALGGMAANELGRARISMMVRSINFNTRPDTIWCKTVLSSSRFPLQRTAGPYKLLSPVFLQLTSVLTAKPNSKSDAVSL
jgi:hypothetical protein